MASALPLSGPRCGQQAGARPGLSAKAWGTRDPTLPLPDPPLTACSERGPVAVGGLAEPGPKINARQLGGDNGNLFPFCVEMSGDRESVCVRAYCTGFKLGKAHTLMKYNYMLIVSLVFPLQFQLCCQQSLIAFILIVNTSC